MALTVNSPKKPVPEGFGPAFKELSKTAQSLNSATDKLNKVIEKLDSALKSLNLGVTAWVKFDESSDDDMKWEFYQIGYDKVGGKWGIALAHCEGHPQWPEDDKSTRWSFVEAPRELRVRAVAHIPQLIEELNSVASKFVEQVTQKTTEASELAAALESLSGFPPPPRTSGGGQ